MVKVKVLSFNTERLASHCKVIECDDDQHYVGQRFYIDLTVNGDFGEVLESTLVGKTVVVRGLQPHEYLGIDVEIVND